MAASDERPAPIYWPDLETKKRAYEFCETFYREIVEPSGITGLTALKVQDDDRPSVLEYCRGRMSGEKMVRFNAQQIAVLKTGMEKLNVQFKPKPVPKRGAVDELVPAPVRLTQPEPPEWDEGDDWESTPTETGAQVLVGKAETEVAGSAGLSGVIPAPAETRVDTHSSDGDATGRHTEATVPRGPVPGGAPAAALVPSPPGVSPPASLSPRDGAGGNGSVGRSNADPLSEVPRNALAEKDGQACTDESGAQAPARGEIFGEERGLSPYDLWVSGLPVSAPYNGHAQAPVLPSPQENDGLGPLSEWHRMIGELIAMKKAGEQGAVALAQLILRYGKDRDSIRRIGRTVEAVYWPKAGQNEAQ